MKMRKFYDMLMGEPSATSMKAFVERIEGDVLPTEVGDYITNFGRLHFNGTTFLMNGHIKPTPTIVEYWLKEPAPAVVGTAM